MKHNHQIAGAVAKGLVTGAVVGTAAYMMAGSSKKKTASMIKKNAGKALRAVGGVSEYASYMMK